MTQTHQGANRDDAPLILIVDDDPDIVQLLVRLLQNSGYRTTAAEDGETGIAIAHKYRPHAILLDITLPGMNGFEVCQAIKERPSIAETPIIFLTGMGRTDEVIERCFNLGANDFISKPYSSVELIARLRVVLRERALRDEYRRLAVEDSLTHLSNRRQFLIHVGEAIELARSNPNETILIIGDVDNIHGINEQHGHDLGDEVILTFARLMDRYTGIQLKAGRLGDDALAMVMIDSNREAGLRACERLARTLSAIAFDAATRPKHFTACFGAASYDGEPAAFDVDAFLVQADIALYAAKLLGRGRIVGFWQLDRNALPLIPMEKRHSRARTRFRSERAYVGPAAPRVGNDRAR